MADLIALPLGADAAIVLTCGHVRALSHPAAAAYFRQLIAAGSETVCMECPMSDDRRFVTDVIVRHD